MLNIGDKIPSGEFNYVKVEADEDQLVCSRPGPPIKTDDWKGKKIVFFGVPGAFTPTCQEQHIPGFLEHAADFRSKGVDDVYCVATNDPFVLAAWARLIKAGGKVTIVSDSTAKWLKEAGLELDLTQHGMGVRSSRFALIVDDLVVKYIAKEEGPGGVTGSSADSVLAKL